MQQVARRSSGDNKLINVNFGAVSASTRCGIWNRHNEIQTINIPGSIYGTAELRLGMIINIEGVIYELHIPTKPLKIRSGRW
jgi:hypothetical protein